MPKNQKENSLAEKNQRKKGHFSYRLKVLLEKHKLSQAELAKRAGLSQQEINNLCTGYTKNIRASAGIKIARALQTTLEYLMDGIITMQAAGGNVTFKMGADSVNMLPKAPLIGWEEITTWKEHKDMLQHSTKHELYPLIFGESPDSFLLEVQDDSMQSSLANAHSFLKGEVIIVDPLEKVSNGDFVICQLDPDETRCVFKQYKLIEGKAWLCPLNSQYKAVEMPRGAKIHGVVTSSHRRFKKK
jgi:SOS-response transcriptional repressor LexA